MTSAWKTIDSAPRDGTPIMLVTPWQGKHLRYIASWHVKLGMWGKGEFADSIFPPHMQDGFTFWMPLPSPPGEGE